jgi:hypothetical protein
MDSNNVVTAADRDPLQQQLREGACRRDRGSNLRARLAAFFGVLPQASRTRCALLARFDSATWFDRRVVGIGTEAARDAGVGREVRVAQTLRRQWLLDRQLTDADDVQRLQTNLLATLGRRELLRVAGQLAGELGLVFVEAKSGSVIDGRLTRHIDLAHGRFAVIEKSKKFTLVPWLSVLQRQAGKRVSDIVRGEAVSWVIERGRSGPAMS